ncbi:ATP-binding protein [Ferroacidibacillus organovorans]|uniref:AAA family ATPase n=1 Tax=Ferroacidibacillus organovorans TaxID=1765683 RepID=A0A1V4ER34_9BACL|nr:ATP-binding protein [Ferroacidibacillus organovorans]OPG15389.1 AAA family ATPase [Ferroacidibacillus organovorans]
MNHEAEVRKIVSAVNATTGLLKSRESNTVEFKESFNAGSTAKYAKTMAAFANNRGGYIMFGVKDNPREVIGLKNNNLEDLNQEKYTDTINSLFSPSIEWECGTFPISIEKPITGADGGAETKVTEKRIGWIYTEEAERKPVIAQKTDNGEKIVSGDVFYRYRARSEKIKFAEMSRIIEERTAKEREHLLKLFEVIRKSGTANLGIINYGNGKFTTPYDVDVAFDRKLVTQVLKKAKFIKEGSFNETEGIPVIKVTGSIDLAEEVPVLDLDPDKGYPYIQKVLAKKLILSTQDLYALIWYYKMKEAKKYHIEVTTSGSSKVHKFSEFSFQFLKEKLEEMKSSEAEFEKIRAAYRNRDK